MDGEKIENLVDHPAFRTGINSVAVTYDLSHDPSYLGLSRVHSPIIGEEISRWTHVMRDEQDALIKTRLMAAMGEYLCPCTYRCITGDVLSAAYAVSYEIDRSHVTAYHQNVLRVVEQAQKEDWVIGGGLISPKGDRSKGVTAQADPDMYLHVVEKRADGIVVRGAKAHSTAAP